MVTITFRRARFHREINSQLTVAILKQERGVIKASTGCDPLRHICQFYQIPLPLADSPDPHCSSLSPHPPKQLAELPLQHLLTYSQASSQPTPQLLRPSLPACPFLWQQSHYPSYRFRTTGGCLARVWHPCGTSCSSLSKCG